MFSHITTLTLPKSEHTDETNEDAHVACPSQGLFAVADGLGSMLFSRLWAHILVHHFARTPFLSGDPFELEWWLSLAQQQYEQQKPDINALPWQAQRKAREGSASTFAACCISASSATSITADAFSIGDSCIFWGNEETQMVNAFPLQEEAAFDRAPISLPSLQWKFNRAYHRCLSTRIKLHQGDILILATDAVARWLLSHANQRDRWLAFRGLAGMTKETWPAFITGCRAHHEMADDDATVVIIHLSTIGNGGMLSIATPHSPAVIGERQRAFAAALKEQDKERVAIFYGDGQDFKHLRPKVALEMIQDARCVAEAINEVKQVYFNAFNLRNASTLIEQVWKKHEATFQKNENRICVEKLLRMLQANGVLQDTMLPAVESSSPRAREENTPFDFFAWLGAAIQSLLRRSERQ